MESTKEKVFQLLRESMARYVKPGTEITNRWCEEIIERDIGEHNGWEYEIPGRLSVSGNPEVIDVEEAVRLYQSMARYL